MCLAISFADQRVHEGETRLLALLGGAFGLEKARVEALTAELKGG